MTNDRFRILNRSKCKWRFTVEDIRGKVCRREGFRQKKTEVLNRKRVESKSIERERLSQENKY